jgi:hypothetical protein
VAEQSIDHQVQIATAAHEYLLRQAAAADLRARSACNVARIAQDAANASPLSCYQRAAHKAIQKALDAKYEALELSKHQAEAKKNQVLLLQKQAIIIAEKFRACRDSNGQIESPQSQASKGIHDESVSGAIIEDLAAHSGHLERDGADAEEPEPGERGSENSGNQQTR